MNHKYQEQLENLNSQIVINSTFQDRLVQEEEKDDYADKEQLQIIKQRLQEDLNLSLQGQGFPILEFDDFQKVTITIQALLRQRRQDLEFRNNYSKKIQKTESQLNSIQKQYETMKVDHKQQEEQLKSIQKQCHSHQVHIKQLQQTHKQESDDLIKQLNKAKQKEQIYQNEFKKKEYEYGQLQNHLHSLQSSNVKIDIINSSNASKKKKDNHQEYDFHMFLNNAYKKNHDQIVNENKELRKLISDIVRQFKQIGEYKGIHKAEQYKDIQKLIEKPFEDVKQEMTESIKTCLEQLKQIKEVPQEKFEFPEESMDQVLKGIWEIVDTQDTMIKKNIIKKKVQDIPANQQKQYHILNDQEIENCRKDLLKFKQFMDKRKEETERNQMIIDNTHKEYNEQYQCLQNEIGSVQQIIKK